LLRKFTGKDTVFYCKNKKAINLNRNIVYFCKMKLKTNIPDLIAGLSIAGLLLPEAVAYSGIADLPPQAGIIGLFAGLLCYGLLGSSRFAIVSATSSAAVVLSVAIGELAPGSPESRLALSFAAVIMAGVLFLIAAAAKLGNVTDFIAKPVLRGFTFGLTIVIVVKQFAAMVDLQIPGQNIFYALYDILKSVKDWNFVGLGIGAASLFLLFICSKIKYLPGGLIVIALGILLNYPVDLSKYHVALVGNFDLGLKIPAIPAFPLEQWLHLAETGLALTLVLYSESYGSIRSFALKHNDAISPNRDLMALGLSNVLSGLFGGVPVGAGYSGTSANESSGAETRMSGLFSAAIVLLIVLTLLPVIVKTPEPVLFAIVIHAVSHALNIKIFTPYITWKRDRSLVIIAVISVLILGILDGLLATVVVSLVILLKRLSETKISILGRLGQSHNFVRLISGNNAKPVEDFLILRLDQPLFFANCEKMLSQVRDKILKEGNNIHHIVISLEESPTIDSSTIESFRNFFTFIIDRKKQLTLARLKDPVYEALQYVCPSDGNIRLSGLSVDDAVTGGLQ
jgi:MFS superfamily sulfate permease-like transporter